MLSDLDKNNEFFILIPSLNPTNDLIVYIDELIKNNFTNIIVVNDGSKKECDEIFKAIERKKECILLKHETNLGKGKALKDGLEYLIFI